MNGYFIPEPHQKPTHPDDEMDGPNCKTYTLKMLRQCAGSELPLRVKVTSTKADEGHAVYHFATTSVTSMNTWHASYRYSEVLAFRNHVEEEWTCHDDKCSGSCESLRDLIEASFPRKGLGILSTWTHTVEDRKLKFKNVLIHLLRSVLLPGSTMKCFHARQHLPKHLFAFLGVEADADKRTLLQVYVDNHQGGIKKSATTADLSKLAHKSSVKKSATTSDLASMSVTVSATAPSEPSQCMVCLEDVGLHVDGEGAHNGEARVELQCKHAFHRECIFEWLTFQYHCPVCRAQVGPSAMTNYCRPKNQMQWWLGNFNEDPLEADTE
uniref:RING-type domain-containing protein n=1 Tax=Phytophthora ramorum TaxID=164328 RepID=H3GXA8_PHYRM